VDADESRDDSGNIRLFAIFLRRRCHAVVQAYSSLEVVVVMADETSGANLNLSTIAK